MTRVDLRQYYEILELPDGAALNEVQNAYLRLKRLYTGTSVVLAPRKAEFSEATRKKNLFRLEKAYDRLRAALAEERPKPKNKAGEETGGTVPEIDRLDEITYSGGVLRKIRERKGLNEGAVTTELKIRTDLLRALEEERFENLPQEAFLKGHLRSIAQWLGLRPERVVEDYIRRYRAWKDNPRKE